MASHNSYKNMKIHINFPSGVVFFCLSSIFPHSIIVYFFIYSTNIWWCTWRRSTTHHLVLSCLVLSFFHLSSFHLRSPLVGFSLKFRWSMITRVLLIVWHKCSGTMKLVYSLTCHTIPFRSTLPHLGYCLLTFDQIHYTEYNDVMYDVWEAVEGCTSEWKVVIPAINCRVDSVRWDFPFEYLQMSWKLREFVISTVLCVNMWLGWLACHVTRCIFNNNCTLELQFSLRKYWETYFISTSSPLEWHI